MDDERKQIQLRGRTVINFNTKLVINPLTPVCRYALNLPLIDALPRSGQNKIFLRVSSH